MTDTLELHPHQWHLILSPPPGRFLAMLAYLAIESPVIVLDCGRRFDSSIVARAARGRQEIIDKIHIQRAFTCHEAVKLLEQSFANTSPVVVLDFLSTFNDENVKQSARSFLLEISLHHFGRLSRGAGLAVSIYPPPASDEATILFERLIASAPRVSSYAPLEQETQQMDLF